MEIIKLKPIFKQMIWGGDRLKNEFNYPIDLDNVGECWGISAHKHGDCLIYNGKYAGMKLSELYKEHKELFGNLDSDVFPLLTKIIDAKNDLSIQVHPNDEYAYEHENGSLGKIEFWYVIDAEPNANIVIGHNAKTHDEVENMIKEKKWNEFIRTIPVKAGDCFMIEPGTIHAIKGGTLILETQQNSDITYRVYDYDRLQNGKPRPLHIKESIDVIKAPFISNVPCIDNNITINKNIKQYMTCDYFTVWGLNVKNNLELIQDQPCMLISITDGYGKINGEKIKKGDHFILPNEYGNIDLNGDFNAIVSSPKKKVLKK